MTIYALLLNGLVILLIGVAQAALPSYSRRTIFFSVTVPVRFWETNDAHSILHQFRRFILLWTVVAEALVGASYYGAASWLLLASILALLGGVTGAYARARNQARPYGVAPSTERIAPLAGPSDGLYRRYMSLVGALLPLVAAALFAWSRWDRFPDTKALSNAFAANGALNAMFLLLAVAILHGARRGSPLRSVNLTVLTAIIATNSAATALFTALRWLESSERFSGQAIPLTWILVLAAIIGWGLRKASQLRDSADTTPDECWKLGQFYYNPDDPAYLVERRFGLGYSPNFAKPSACIATAVYFLLPAIVIATLVITRS